MLDSKDIGEVDGFSITLSLDYDPDFRPTDFDCYTPRQIEAWMQDSWWYVYALVTASKEGIELGHAGMGGTECGYFTITDLDDNFIDAIRIDIDSMVRDRLDGYLDDMIKEAIAEGRATLAKLTA